MNPFKLMMLGIVTVACLVSAQAASAACTGFGNKVLSTVNLSGTVNVARDTPVGTVIYRKMFPQPASTVTVTCPTAELMTAILTAKYQTPSAVVSGGGAVLAGKIYETNIPGIGFAVNYKGIEFGMPFEYPVKNLIAPGICTEGVECVMNLYLTLGEFEIIFIKTADTTGAGSILAANLSPVVIGWKMSTERQIGTMKMAGSLGVTQNTCTIPKTVSVDMGTQYAAPNLPVDGLIGEASDFSIKLTNCPAVGGSQIKSGANIGHALTYRLDPTSGTVPRKPNVLALIDEPGVAKGVGIRIDTSAGTQVKFSTVIDSGLMPSMTKSSDYELKFRAQYVKTGSVFDSGKANATMTFIIDYH